MPTSAAAGGTARPAAFVNAGFVCDEDGPGRPELAPLLGEHTETVLQTLGYSEAQIRELIERGVVLAGKRHPGRDQG